MEQIEVKLSDIPNDPNVDFKDSTYFKLWEELPSPAEVRAVALAQHQAGICTDSRRTFDPGEPNWDPPPVLFQEKCLWVKWGRRVRLSEGQSLYVIQKFLADVFPIPEIYGWRTDDSETFIYCKWSQGQTLERAWDAMKVDERIALSHELRGAFGNLRRLHQEPQEQFVGTPARSTLYDRSFGQFTSKAGPFQSVKAFHDWFAWAHRTRIPGEAKDIPIEPFRYRLLDDVTLRFTHSDLHPSKSLSRLRNPTS